jgi:hypothetical protein
MGPIFQKILNILENLKKNFSDSIIAIVAL